MSCLWALIIHAEAQIPTLINLVKRPVHHSWRSRIGLQIELGRKPELTKHFTCHGHKPKIPRFAVLSWLVFAQPHALFHHATCHVHMQCHDEGIDAAERVSNYEKMRPVAKDSFGLLDIVNHT